MLTCDTGLTVAAAAGIATFGGCRVDRPGSYGLRAEANGLPGASSSQLHGDGRPIRLVFATEPTGTAGGATAGRAARRGDHERQRGHAHDRGREHAARDARDRCQQRGRVGELRERDDRERGRGSRRRSPAARSARRARATRSLATAGSAVPATTEPFDVLDPSGTVALPGLSHRRERRRDPVGRERPPGRTGHRPGRVRLRRRAGASACSGRSTGRPGRTPAQIAVTDATGLASITYRPVTNAWYRAVVEQDPDLAIGTGPSTRVTVRQLVLLRPTNSGDVKSVARRTRIEFKVTVRPSSAAVPPGDATLAGVPASQRSLAAGLDAGRDAERCRPRVDLRDLCDPGQLLRPRPGQPDAGQREQRLEPARAVRRPLSAKSRPGTTACRPSPCRAS